MWHKMNFQGKDREHNGDYLLSPTGKVQVTSSFKYIRIALEEDMPQIKKGSKQLQEDDSMLNEQSQKLIKDRRAIH